MRQVFGEERIEVHAWCHMRNHVHVLLRADLSRLSRSMQRLETSYSHYFNGKYGVMSVLYFKGDMGASLWNRKSIF